MISSYQQICPVVFGEGAVAETGKKVKEFGCAKAIVVCDAGVKNAGITDKVCASLDEAGVPYVVFADVTADPTDTIIDKASDCARENGADIVIGVGGGSSLDAAKCVAIMIKNPGQIKEYYAGVGKPYTEKAPVILLPTASGTGSEVTPMAVVTDTTRGVKDTILNSANLAIVDPALTLTVPPHVTAATGFDALSHAVESYTTNCGNPKSAVLALHAMKLITENLETACKDGSNIEARTNLSFAANIAGMSFGDASVHFGHAAAHEMGARFHIAHGALCAITLPEVIIFAADTYPDRIFKMADAMNVEIPEGTDAPAAAELIASTIRERMHAVNIKPLKDFGLTREQVVDCAEGAVKNNWFVICAPKTVDVPVMADLLGKMYDHYQ